MQLRTGPNLDWIALSGQSCGVQGTIFGYADGITCAEPGTAGVCKPNGTDTCCLSGTTVLNPAAAQYGCGMGMNLNDPGGTQPKLAYSGAAIGFDVTITGSFPKNAMLRFVYSPAGSTPATQPYKDVKAVAGTHRILFTDVCLGGAATCAAPTAAPVELKIHMQNGQPGLETSGAFAFCITKIVPVVSP